MALIDQGQRWGDTLHSLLQYMELQGQTQLMHIVIASLLKKRVFTRHKNDLAVTNIINF